MTTTPNSIVTTTPTQPAASIPPLTSYDFIALDHLTRIHLRALQSSIAQVTEQWWTSLTRSQRSALSVPPLNLKISVSRQQPPSHPSEK